MNNNIEATSIKRSAILIKIVPPPLSSLSGEKKVMKRWRSVARGVVVTGGYRLPFIGMTTMVEITLRR